MDLAAFDYELPSECIAQHPWEPRDQARLFVYHRITKQVTHALVRDLPSFLNAGDLLVANASRVVPARLRGKKHSGGAAEALLLEKVEGGSACYRALVGCRGKLRVGLELEFEGEVASQLEAKASMSSPDAAPSNHRLRLAAKIIELGERGEVILEFDSEISPYAIGEMPLPPYIHRSAPEREDVERYQTLFSRTRTPEPSATHFANTVGSVAAPTAGLHFTEALLQALAAKSIEHEKVLLHVGPGTFRPLDVETLRRGELHEESFEISQKTSDAIARARRRGGRVVAIGTTTTRVLESQAQGEGLVRAGCGATKIFLYPGYRFRVVDALLTNFHLPRSSLLLLVAAFAGREEILECYAQAIREGYRFYSYGDAMLIL